MPRLIAEDPRWLKRVLYKLVIAGVDLRDAGVDHNRRLDTISFFFPYSIKGKELEALLRICHRMGLEVRLNGSSYYSKDTLMIAIYKKHDDAKYEKFLAGLQRRIAREVYEA
jgi:hypothetical protein